MLVHVLMLSWNTIVDDTVLPAHIPSLFLSKVKYNGFNVNLEQNVGFFVSFIAYISTWIIFRNWP